jgi:FSR family fosmidomycin resistance protein-like MFS transporter
MASTPPEDSRAAVAADALRGDPDLDLDAGIEDGSSSGPVTVRTAGMSAGAAVVLVAVAHAVNDSYSAFLAPLLPRIMDNLGISIALAATLAMALSLATSVLQPLMGYLADRYDPRWFIASGPFLGGIFLSSIGLAPSFEVLLLLLVIGGLGSSAFHPPGASMAARVGAGKGSGARLSIFSFGGAMGYAVGPLVAVGLVAAVGLEGLWIAAIPGVLLAVVLVRMLPPPAEADRHPLPPPSPRQVLRRLMGPLGVVFAISALGSFAQRAYLTFMPIIVAEAGGSEALGAGLLTAYLTTQAAGTLSGGILTDRVDRVGLLLTLAFVGFPAHVLAVTLEPGSALSFAAGAVAGFTNMAMLPVLVIIGQELLPEGAAVSAGIVMGLAWATGSVGILGVGVVADVVGPVPAAAWAMPALALAGVLALHPVLRAHRRPQVDHGAH